MLDATMTWAAHLLTWMFVAGVAGCAVAIPITAYKMFSVLFEADRADD